MYMSLVLEEKVSKKIIIILYYNIISIEQEKNTNVYINY